MRCRVYQILLLSLFALQAQAAEDSYSFDIATYYNIANYPPPPKFGEFASFLWEDVKNFTFRINPKKNYLALSGIAASSALLVYYDQEITDRTQAFSHDIGLLDENESGRETITVIDFSIGGLDLPFRLPTNTISTFYFLGDAFTHVSLFAGFTAYGYFNDNARAKNTGTQVLEGALLTGIVIQVLKRTFGRESPFERTEDGGHWDLFPNQIKYALHVSKYDAMPAGHMATALTSTLIIAANYPEYRFIKPIGYTAMVLIGYGMVTNGVHWAGDYPLGLAVGYLAAQVIIDRAQKRRHQYNRNSLFSSVMILPDAPSPDAVGVRLFAPF